MEIEKIRDAEKEIRLDEKHAIEIALSRFIDACFLLRRSLVNLAASPAKERLLFYLDKLISMDVLFSMAGIDNILHIMCFLVEQKDVTTEVRHQVLYVSELFERMFGLVEKA